MVSFQGLILHAGVIHAASQFRTHVQDHKQPFVKKQWPYFLLAFVVPVTVVLWWWGLFASAEIQVGERGGYHYAYLEAEGAYSKLGARQKEVLAALDNQGITAGPQITLMQSDPRNTPYDELRAQTGFIVDAGATPAAPLKLGVVPSREVAVASIKAHPLFAYGKTYSALLDYLERNDMTLHLPTVEIYEDSVLRVEMPLAAATTMLDNTGAPR